MTREPHAMAPKMRKLEAATVERVEGSARSMRPSSMDVETLRAIVEIVEKSDVTRLEWRRGDERLLLRRGPVSPRRTPFAAAAPLAAVSPIPAMAPATPQAAPAQPAAAAPAPASIAKIHVVTSPFVGTFYRAPSPEAPPFVEIGQHVRKGQVLCIVEAMKLMNEIESEVGGRVVEVLGQSGHPVEFGQALFKIEMT